MIPRERSSSSNRAISLVGKIRVSILKASFSMISKSSQGELFIYIGISRGIPSNELIIHGVTSLERVFMLSKEGGTGFPFVRMSAPSRFSFPRSEIFDVLRAGGSIVFLDSGRGVLALSQKGKESIFSHIFDDSPFPFMDFPGASFDFSISRMISPSSSSIARISVAIFSPSVIFDLEISDTLMEVSLGVMNE